MTSTSSRRMRTLSRLSAISRCSTVPMPVQGEPSRRTADVLKISRVNIFKARPGYGQGAQLTTRVDDGAGDAAADVGRRVDAEATVGDRRDARHSGNAGQPVGDAIAAGLDVDHVGATEHVAHQVVHAPGQTDATLA